MKKFSFLLILVSALGFSKLNCIKKRYSSFKSGIKKRLKRPSFLGGKKPLTFEERRKADMQEREDIMKERKSAAAKERSNQYSIESAKKGGTGIAWTTGESTGRQKRFTGVMGTDRTATGTAKSREYSQKKLDKAKKDKLSDVWVVSGHKNVTLTPADIKAGTGFTQQTPQIAKPTTKPTSRWSQFKKNIGTYGTRARTVIRKDLGTLASPFQTAGRKVGGLRKDPYVRGVTKGFTPKAFWKKKKPIVQQLTPFQKSSRVTQPQPSLLQPSVAPAGQTPAWKAGAIKPQVRPRSTGLTRTPPKPTQQTIRGALPPTPGYLPQPDFGPPPAIPQN